MRLNERGEPVYGERDRPDLAAMRAIGRPFWLAGSFGTPQRLREALEAGATGVQVGTAFAFCEESGLEPALRRHILDMARRGEIDVRTDPRASPAGFPFKVLHLPGSVSETAVYQQRSRVCDLGYLRHAYRRDDGTLGWRCPAEPIEAWTAKDGSFEETTGRKCVCNGLLANVGLAQVRRSGHAELPLVTTGDELAHLAAHFGSDADPGYSARDVIDYLLAPLPAAI